MNLPSVRVPKEFSPVNDYGILPLLALGAMGILTAGGVAAYGVKKVTETPPDKPTVAETISGSATKVMIAGLAIAGLLWYMTNKKGRR